MRACTGHLVDRHQLLKCTLPRPLPSNRIGDLPLDLRQNPAPAADGEPGPPRPRPRPPP
jgi:hypothetical protein